MDLFFGVLILIWRPSIIFLWFNNWGPGLGCRISIPKEALMNLRSTGGDPWRPRRARRSSRAGKQLRWAAFTASLLCLACLAFFGMRVPFDGVHHGHVNDGAFGNQLQNNTVSYAKSDVPHPRIPKELNFSGRSRPKSRKRHGPCEVGLVESIDYLVEPQEYLNYTQFSLEYINKEEFSEPQFGGHQSLEQREHSFHARSQKIHCGFVNGPEGYPSTGFDLSKKDMDYMASCKVVVSSCIFGSSDFLRRPTSSKIGAYSKDNVCFMMFLDELTLAKLSSEGHLPDENGNIGLWKVIIVKNLPYEDMRKTGKVPKFLAHRLFPSARYSIWIDSKMRLHTDPMLILEYFLWRTKSEYAISNHYDRHCVWDEVIQNKRLNKYNHTAIDEQFKFYQSDGLVKFNESDPSSPLPSRLCQLDSLLNSYYLIVRSVISSHSYLSVADVPEGSFIVRAHTPMSNLFSCLWFNEVNRFTSRDQLSFAYTFLKLKRMNPGKPFYFNMFKDCERRALAKLFHHRVEVSQEPPPHPIL